MCLPPLELRRVCAQLVELGHEVCADLDAKFARDLVHRGAKCLFIGPDASNAPLESCCRLFSGAELLDQT